MEDRRPTKDEIYHTSFAFDAIAIFAPSMEKRRIAYGHQHKQSIEIYNEKNKRIVHLHIRDHLHLPTKSPLKFIFTLDGTALLIFFEKEGHRVRWDYKENEFKVIAQITSKEILGLPMLLSNGDIIETYQEKESAIQYTQDTWNGLCIRDGSSLCISHDRAQIICEEEGTLALYPITDPEQHIGVLPNDLLEIYRSSIAKIFSSKHQTIYFLEEDCLTSIHLPSPQKNRKEKKADTGKYFSLFALSPSEKNLAVLVCEESSIDETVDILIVDPATFKPLHTIKMDQIPTQLTFTDDNRALICSGESFVQIFSVHAFNLRETLNSLRQEKSVTKKKLQRACILYQLSLLDDNPTQSEKKLRDAIKLFTSLPSPSSEEKDNFENIISTLLLENLTESELDKLAKEHELPIARFTLAMFYLKKCELSRTLEYLNMAIAPEPSPKKSFAPNLFQTISFHSFNLTAFQHIYLLASAPHFNFSAINDLIGYYNAKRYDIASGVIQELLINAIEHYSNGDDLRTTALTMNLLGELYEKENDILQATHWYQKSAELLKDQEGNFNPARQHLNAFSGITPGMNGGNGG